MIVMNDEKLKMMMKKLEESFIILTIIIAFISLIVYLYNYFSSF
jgi:hypothetical protein